MQLREEPWELQGTFLSLELLTDQLPSACDLGSLLAWRLCAGMTGDRNKLCTPWATCQPKAFCTLLSSGKTAPRSRKLLWHQLQLCLLTWGGSQRPAAWEGSRGDHMESRERQESTRHPILHGTSALAVHILRACNSHSCTPAALHYTIFLYHKMGDDSPYAPKIPLGMLFSPKEDIIPLLS